MDSLYNLAVRLELSAGGMMQAAEGAIATFARMEASAGRMERAVRGMHLTLDTQGLGASAQEAMGVFRTLEMQGGKTGEAFRAMGLSGGLSPLLQDYRAATTELGNMETAATAAERQATALGQSLQRMEYVSRAGIPGAANPAGGVFADTSTNRSYAYTRTQALAADTEANALRYTHLPVAQTAAADASLALQTQLATQTTMLEDHAAAQEKRASRAQGLVMGGAVMAGAGFLGLGVIKGWVKDAEGMQDALAKVSLATTGTSAQLAALQSQSYTVAGQTQYSAPQIMDMEARMGRMGINRRDWVAQDIPTIARAAEIDQRMANISPDASVPAMISQAHMLGATHGKAFIDNIALGTRALLASGMTPDEQNTTLKYLLPAKNATGMTNAEMFQWASLSNLMGLSQGKGGSYLGAMFAKLVPGVGTKTHLEALARLDELGGGHIYEHGNMVSSDKVQHIIARALAAESTAAAKQALAYYAFGTQGERAAFALTSPAAMASSDMLRHKLAPYDPVKNPTGIASVEEMQQKLNQTMVGQLNTLNTNMHSMGAMLGGELIPNLTKAASALVQLTGGMIAFGQQHPVFVRIAAVATAAATAISLIGAPILIATAAFNVLAAAGGGVMAALGLGAGGAGLAAGLAGIAAAAWPIVAVGAAIAGVVLLVTHWNDVMRFMGEFTQGLVTAFSPLLQVFHSLGDLLGPLVRFGADLVGQLFSPLGSAAHSAALELEHLLGVLNIMRVHPATIGTGTGLHPQSPLVRNLPDHAIRGSTVTTLPPVFDPSQVLGGGTVGLPSGSLGFKPFVAPHPTRAAGQGGSVRPVVNMHPGAVPVTINLHVGEGADHATTGKKLARHVAAVFHSEIDAAIRNAQGQSLDMNGHYA